MIAIVKNLKSYRRNVIAAAPKLCCCHVPKCAGSSLWKAVVEQTYTAPQKLMMKRFVLNVHACGVAAALDDAGQRQDAPPPLLGGRPASREEHVLSTVYPAMATAMAAYHLADPGHAYVKGHFHCPPPMVERFTPDWSFLTILRHPVDRFISAFVYDSFKEKEMFRNRLDIEAFLDSQRGYYEGKIYLYHFSDYFRDPVRDPARVAQAQAEALANLARFRLVGVVEEMDEWLDRFAAAFGRRLAIPRINSSPKPEMAGRIRSDPGLMRRIEALCETDLEIYERARAGRFA